MYIRQDDNYSTWLEVARCLKIWDLDGRGFHKGLWRLFLNGHHLLVVQVPSSPYSYVQCMTQLSFQKYFQLWCQFF